MKKLHIKWFAVISMFIFASSAFGQANLSRLIKNRINAKYLHKNVNNLIPKNVPFYIQSAVEYGHSNKAYWDLPGRGKNVVRTGAPLKVYALLDRDVDRKYEFENSSTRGYLKIHVKGYAAYVDVKGGKNRNGTPLQIYRPNNTSSQNFNLVYEGNGKFKIFNQRGRVILLSHRSSRNGTQLEIWDNQNGPWTEWYLIDARTNKPFRPGNNAGSRLVNNRSGRNVRHNNPRRIDLAKTLRMKGTYTSDFFLTCSADELNNGNLEVMKEYLAKQPVQERSEKIIQIINGTSQNNDINVRRMVYKTLASVPVDGGGFLIKILKKSLVNKTINMKASAERDLIARRYLERIAVNFKK